MARLTDKQRLYVLSMAADPFGTPTGWARAAGYSDHMERAKVAGHTLSHDPKIEAAVQEYAKTALGTLGPMLASAGLLRIARKKDHPHHFRALEAIANRVGLHETTEHHVKVQHTDRTGAAMIERIRALAAKHGMDPGALLGQNAAAGGAPVAKELPAPIDAEYQEVKDDG
jgi:phage terminase small subunit